MTILTHYWNVEFSDGFVLSQFNKEGKEVLIKDIISDKCWKLNSEGKKELDFDSNFFEKLENIHGKVTNVEWLEFTLPLYEKIKSVNPDIDVAIFKKSGIKIKQKIPPKKYANIKRTVDVKYGINSNTSSVIMSSVWINVFPRKPTWFSRKPRYAEYKIKVKEK